MDEIFMKRVGELRKEKGVSLDEMSKAIGVSGSSIGYYERGERLPNIDILKKLCEFFNVTSDYLIGLTNTRIPENADIGNPTGLSDKAVEYLKTRDINLLMLKEVREELHKLQIEKNAPIRKATGLSDEAISQLSLLNQKNLSISNGTRVINLLLEHSNGLLLALEDYYYGDFDKFDVVYCDAPLNIDGENRELTGLGGIKNAGELGIGYRIKTLDGKTGGDYLKMINGKKIRELARLEVITEVENLYKELYGDSDNGDGNKA